MGSTIETLHGPWAWAKSVQYSQAVRVGDLVFTGGIAALDEHGELPDEDFAAQTRRTFRNLEAVLAEFGADLTNVAQMTVHVADPDDYATFREIRPEFLRAPYPASTAVGAGRLLADGLKIEITAVASIGGVRQERAG